MLRALMLCGIFGGLCGGARAEPPRVRSVILISLDTWRADRLGRSTASGQAISPNLDRWGRAAVVFERMIAPATWTVPAHASMFTSLYPSFHGAGGALPQHVWRGISPESVTLAQVLSEHGLRTQGFFMGEAMDPKFGFGKGFDDYSRSRFMAESEQGGLRETTFLAAAGWVRQHRNDRFFLFLHTGDVHRHINMDLAAGSAWRCPPLSGSAPGRHEEVPGSSGTFCARVESRYDLAVHCADQEIGAFLDALEREGLLGTTLVAVTGDHGEALCDKRLRSPMVGHAYAPYEEQIAVPFILHWPGAGIPGRRIATAVRTIDIMPTVLQALDVPEPPGLQGRSLWPLLQAAREPEPAFIEHDDWWALRTARYKYLMFLGGGEELYDLEQDPGETHDLAAERPRETAAMRERVRAFMGRGRLGWHLMTRGRPGDKFSVRIASERPLVYHTAFLTDKEDVVRISEDRKVLDAELSCGVSGDEDWLIFHAGGGSLRMSVTRNGEPLSDGTFFVGASSAALRGPLELRDPGVWRRAALAAFAPPAAAEVLLWRARNALSGVDMSDDAELREALRAAGYLGR